MALYSEALAPVSDGEGSVLALQLYLQLHALDVVHHVGEVFGAALRDDVASHVKDWISGDYFQFSVTCDKGLIFLFHQ